MTVPTNDRRIAYLWHAVSLGSIRAAADALDLDPSGLSRQIALLEKEVGSPLIQRHSRGIQATEAGRVLVEYHSEQTARFGDVLERIKDIRGLRIGQLHLAMGEGFVSDLMSGVLGGFSQSYPGVRIDIATGGTNEVIRQVTTDEAILGLVYNPPHDPKVRVRCSKVNPLCAIVRPGHKLMKLGRRPTLANIARFDLVAKPISFGTRQLLEQAARMEGVALQHSLTSTHSAILYQLTQETDAVTFGPAFAVRQEVAAGKVVALEIDSPSLLRAKAHLISRVGRTLSPSGQRLMDHLRTHLAALN